MFSVTLWDEVRGRVISLSLKKLTQNRVLIQGPLMLQCLSLRRESIAFFGFSK